VKTGFWLSPLRPATSYRLRLADEAFRVAVALRLGCSVCVANTCRCGAIAHAEGIHGLVCKRFPSRTVSYHAIKDVIVRDISSAEIPITKGPGGFTWDVIAYTYMSHPIYSAGGVAEAVSGRKALTYSALYTFQPIAFEIDPQVTITGA